MRKTYLIICLTFLVTFISTSFRTQNPSTAYQDNYFEIIQALAGSESSLLDFVKNINWNEEGIKQVRQQINKTRITLKHADFWLRYLDPVTYHLVNGPLPVEWETEVFEKFEKPYKRNGAGLSLAAQYLDETAPQKDSLLILLNMGHAALDTFTGKSVTANLNTAGHFFFCNRLYLLNLAAIYTTGFECPDTSRIIPELRSMISNIRSVYNSFNKSFLQTPLKYDYLRLYDDMIDFVNHQPDAFSLFDHFSFIKNYVNPLYTINQHYINDYKAVSRSFVNYSLRNDNFSLFSKNLYYGQVTKGVFLRVTDSSALKLAEETGKLLFYDPILSGNNMRSCASCHKQEEYFTDTGITASLQYNGRDYLPRNTPSLVNVVYNHLLMLDGRHMSLQNQAKDVMTNPVEMASANEDEIVKKLMGCKKYKDAFTKLLAYTPLEDEVSIDHITSAIALYYTRFSNYYSPFDEAMNNTGMVDDEVKKGFNLFMGRAQCGTCHFVPMFNGVKPPYISSEFEVLGVPGNSSFHQISIDSGRYKVNPAYEMLYAFRTGSLRNIANTAPYMHNGVFKTMEEVIDFYDAGGGAGKGLDVPNQTLASDSLHLSFAEKKELIAFMISLTEKIPFEEIPAKLPLSKNEELNKRKPGGIY